MNMQDDTLGYTDSSRKCVAGQDEFEDAFCMKFKNIASLCFCKTESCNTRCTVGDDCMSLTKNRTFNILMPLIKETEINMISSSK